jgi:hypothetical protein
MEQGDRLWHLIAVYCSGEASPEELKELNAIAENDPAVNEMIQLIYNLWQSAEAKDATLNNKAWNKHRKRMKAQSS